MKLKQYLIDHRENLQMFYGILLIVLIPILITYNTASIIGSYNKEMNMVLQKNTLALGRSIYNNLESDLGNTERIQEKINGITRRNSDLKSLEVLVPEGNKFKIIASSRESNIGKSVNSYPYQLAWIQSDNNGIATDSFNLTDSEKQNLGLDYDTEERFWLVTMPMQDGSGNKQAILSLQVSSKVIDNLTSGNRNTSLYVLALTIAVIIFFLSVSIRLWDYAVLYRKIKEVDQMKDEFISIASHELRTPLTAIKGYTSLIIDGTFGTFDNKDMNESLQRIMISAKRLEELVEDLLNVSRLEQGRLSMKKTNIDVEPVIDEIVSQLSITAEEKNLKLVYKKSKEKPPLVCADTERLKQVLINLIGNSIKYTETGSVTVTTETKDGKLRVKVTDTGIGISPEAQKRLFQKFYRVQNDKTEKIQGTGLGLWITKQLVELMGGNIYFESIEGQGTQVIVVLNLAAKVKKK